MIRLGLALLLALPAPALAWGEFGHRAIATIALAEMRPETRRAVKKLLRRASEVDTPTCPLRTLQDAAVWPDCVRGLGDRFAYAVTWHYQNISVCNPFDIAAACPDGGCVTAQVVAQAKLLAQRSRPVEERIVALAFLAHFVGDLHQPLHIGDKGDRGGNDVLANYGAKTPPRMNLHRIWDTELAERALTEPPAVTPTSITPADRAAWRTGGVPEWTREAWDASKDIAYANLRGYPDRCLIPAAPAPSPPLSGAAAGVADSLGAVAAATAAPRATIDEAYIAPAVPVIRVQIERAGVRLAMLLDTALSPPRRRN